MKRRLLINTIIAILLLVVVEQINAQTNPPIGPKGEWVKIDNLSDEFNQTTINSTKWDYNPGDWGVWSWEPDNAFIIDSVLHLQMVQETHTRNNTEFYYKSGITRSKSTMTYGYYEARVKGCERFPGAAPAFWLYSSGKHNLNNVTYSEIDIFEIQQSEWSNGSHAPVEHIDMNLHTREIINGKETWRRPGSWPEVCKHYWLAPWDPRKDFHIYGCEVRPDSIFWYVDGKLRAEEKNHNWHLPMYVTLSMGLRYPFVKYVNGERLPVPEKTTADGFPTSMKTDWVRSYKPVSQFNSSEYNNQIAHSGFEEVLPSEISGTSKQHVKMGSKYLWQGYSRVGFELSNTESNSGYRSLKAKYLYYGSGTPYFIHANYPALKKGNYELSFYYKTEQNKSGEKIIVKFEDDQYRRSTTFDIDTLTLVSDAVNGFRKAKFIFTVEEDLAKFHPRFEMPWFKRDDVIYFDDFKLVETTETAVAKVEKGKSEIAIYPNPAKEKFNVKFNKFGSLDVGIYDVHGRLVFSEKELISNESLNFEISDGMYICIFEKEGKVINRQKLIVK